MLNNLIFLIKSYQILKMILLLKASAIEMFSGTSHINSISYGYNTKKDTNVKIVN
jgi:hypothetical protein